MTGDRAETVKAVRCHRIGKEKSRPHVKSDSQTYYRLCRYARCLAQKPPSHSSISWSMPPSSQLGHSTKALLRAKACNRQGHIRAREQNTQRGSPVNITGTIPATRKMLGRISVCRCDLHMKPGQDQSETNRADLQRALFSRCSRWT